MSTASSRPLARLNGLIESVFDRRESSVLVGLIAIFAVGLFVDAGRVLTLNNLFRVLQSAAIVSMVGYGMALLMVTAEFDLSVGSLFAISGALTAILLSDVGFSPVFTIAVVLAFALIFGLSQGLVVTKLGLPSLIVTIGTLTLMRGAHLLLLGGTAATKHPDEGGLIMEALGGRLTLPFEVTYQLPVVHSEVHTWNSFPVQIIWIFVFLGAFHYLLFYTKFGYHVRATGDNINSVETTGVDPEIIKIAGFGIAALMAGFAGISQLARINSASGGTGDGLALIVIAAVVLGGTKLTGGEGSMVGVLLGALILALAQNVLTIAGFGAGGWQAVITGAFIIAAIGLDTVFKGFSVGVLERLYLDPLGELRRSRRRFFGASVSRKTTDEMVGFLVLSVAATVLLVAVGTGLVAVLAPVAGVADLLEFGLVGGGGLLMAAIGTYLLLALLAVVAFVVVEAASRSFERTGDYESTLAVVSYGMAPAVLLGVPLLLLGYDVVLLGTAVLTALVVAVIVFALIARTMYAGVVELHGLARGQALATVGATVLAWVLVSLWIALNLV